MSSLAVAPTKKDEAVAQEARAGLTATPKTLSPWLFYDEAGSHLFEQITQLPEYYLTRTERAIFTAHADEIIRRAAATSGEAAPTLTLTAPSNNAGTLLRTACSDLGELMFKLTDGDELLISPSQLWKLKPNLV